MEEDARILKKNPVYNLLKGEKDIHIGAEANILCIKLIEKFSESIKNKVIIYVNEQKRKVIKSNDIEEIIKNYKIDYNYSDVDTSIPFTQIRNLLQSNNDLKLSPNAISLFQIFLEKVIRLVGDLSAKVIFTYGRKTLDQDSITRAFQSLFWDEKISYKQFLLDIFTIEELKDQCIKNNLPKSGTKQELVEKLYENHVDLSKIFANYSFSELQTKIIKTNFPVPLNLEQLFEWIDNVSTLPLIKDEKFDNTDLDSHKISDENLILKQELEEKKEDLEELEILEKKMDYSKFFMENNEKLTLREIVRELISIRSLRSINIECDLDIDFSDNKDEIIDKFFQSGISITYFLKLLLLKDLREILKIIGVKISGNKIELVERLLSSIEFIDYDVSHDDIIILLQGKEFIKERDAKKKQEEIIKSKIRNYTGSIKLDLLKIIVELNFEVKDKDLVKKYIELGRDSRSFQNVIGGLLRDGFIFVKPFEEETTYYVPEELQQIIIDTLNEIEVQMKELEGIINELPPSPLILLSLVCGYGEPVDIMVIKEKFFQAYRSNQTWYKSRQMLKERNLIRENFDEENEMNVIYSPKLICPVLNGLMSKKKDIILKAEKEELKSFETSFITLPSIENYSRGTQQLLYMIINSGGNVLKQSLRIAFTSHAAYGHSDNSFLRYIRILKKDNVIEEEKDPDSKETLINLLITNLEELKTDLEENIFDFPIEFIIELLPNSALAMLKIIIHNGGSMPKNELRRQYLKYFSTTSYYNSINSLDNDVLTEGISNSGQLIIFLPNCLIDEIERYFIENPLDLEEKEINNLTIEDIILNLYQPMKLKNVAQLYEISAEQDDNVILKELLYTKHVPLLPLIEKIVSKNELIKICKENQISCSGNKADLIDRILSINKYEIDENIERNGEIKSKNITTSLDDSDVGEKLLDNKDEDLEIKLDKDLVLEAISSCWSKTNLQEESIKLNLRKSGNKSQIIDEIFFSSDISYENLIETFISDEVLSYINSQLNVNNIKKADIITYVKSDKLQFPEKNVKYNIHELLETLTKYDLKLIAKELKVKFGGNRTELIDQIITNSVIPIQEKIKFILKLNPHWAFILNNKLNLLIPEKNSLNAILKVLGEESNTDLKTEDEKVKKKSKPSEKIEKDLGGLLKVIDSTISRENLEMALDDLELNDLEEINTPKSLYRFLNVLGIGDIKEIIKQSDIIVDLNVIKKKSEMIKTLCEKFNIPLIIEYENAKDSITQRMAKLKLNVRFHLANGLSNFARGYIIEGLKQIPNVAEQKQFMDSLHRNNLNDPSVQGFLFEVSVFHALKNLANNNELVHGIKQVEPEIDFNNFQNKDSNADGNIRIKIRDENAENLVSIDCLYDCKSRKDGFSPNDDYLKFIKYLKDVKIKNLERDEKKNWRCFIVFSSIFKVNTKILTKKIKEFDESNKFLLILWEAKSLRQLWNENLINGNELVKYIDWKRIFDFDQKIIHIDEAFINPIIKEAIRDLEKTFR